MTALQTPTLVSPLIVDLFYKSKGILKKKQELEALYEKDMPAKFEDEVDEMLWKEYRRREIVDKSLFALNIHKQQTFLEREIKKVANVIPEFHQFIRYMQDTYLKFPDEVFDDFETIQDFIAEMQGLNRF